MTTGRQPFSPESYWEERYKSDAQAQSFARFAPFKAQVINGVIKEQAIDTVIEFGSGDGSQLAMLHIPHYMGIEISRTAISKMQKKFAHDATKTFLHSSEYSGQRASLALSVGVLSHITDDVVFYEYMQILFSSALNHVLLYATDMERYDPMLPHVKHRNFTAWVARHIDGWKLITHIENIHRNKDSSIENEPGSFYDFYLYGKSQPMSTGQLEPEPS